MHTRQRIVHVQWTMYHIHDDRRQIISYNDDRLYIDAIWITIIVQAETFKNWILENYVNIIKLEGAQSVAI